MHKAFENLKMGTWRKNSYASVKRFRLGGTLANSISRDEAAYYPILYALQKRKHSTRATFVKSMTQDLFVPLIGIEVEVGINKHLSGGIYNLAKNTYKKQLGIRNVTVYCVEGLA